MGCYSTKQREVVRCVDCHVVMEDGVLCALIDDWEMPYVVRKFRLNNSNKKWIKTIE